MAFPHATAPPTTSRTSSSCRRRRRRPRRDGVRPTPGPRARRRATARQRRDDRADRSGRATAADPMTDDGDRPARRRPRGAPGRARPRPTPQRRAVPDPQRSSRSRSSTRRAWRSSSTTPTRSSRRSGSIFRGDPEALATAPRRAAPTSRASSSSFPRGMCRQIVQATAPRTSPSTPATRRATSRSAAVHGPRARTTARPFVRDLDNGRRYGTLEDFRNFVKLAYMTPHLHHSAGRSASRSTCRSTSATSTWSIRTSAGQRQAVHGLGHAPGPGARHRRAGEDRVQRSGADYLDDHTVILSLINANSPLVWDSTMLGAARVYAEANQATLITPFILAGAMSPVTVAGTCAQTLAEALAGMAFVQLVRPGAPVILGSFASLDLDAVGRARPSGRRSPRSSCTSWPRSRGGSACRSAPAATCARRRSPTRRPPTSSAATLQPTILAGVELRAPRRRLARGRARRSATRSSSSTLDQCGMAGVFVKGVDLSENGQALDAIRENGPGSTSSATRTRSPTSRPRSTGPRRRTTTRSSSGSRTARSMRPSARTRSGSGCSPSTRRRRSTRASTRRSSSSSRSGRRPSPTRTSRRALPAPHARLGVRSRGACARPRRPDVRAHPAQERDGPGGAPPGGGHRLRHRVAGQGPRGDRRPREQLQSAGFPGRAAPLGADGPRPAHLCDLVAWLEAAGVDARSWSAATRRSPASTRTGCRCCARWPSSATRSPRSASPATREGHAFIADGPLLDALREKAAFASYMTTQLCFDPAAIDAWIAARRAEGIALPVHLGIPGVAEPQAARDCGTDRGGRHAPVPQQERALRGANAALRRLLQARWPSRRACPDGGGPHGGRRRPAPVHVQCGRRDRTMAQGIPGPTARLGTGLGAVASSCKTVGPAQGATRCRSTDAPPGSGRTSNMPSRAAPRTRRSPTTRSSRTARSTALIAPSGNVEWLCIPRPGLAERLRSDPRSGRRRLPLRAGRRPRPGGPPLPARHDGRWRPAGTRPPAGRSSATPS